jgi:chromosome partitioning protein
MMVNAKTLLHSELLKQARQYCLKKDFPFLDAAVPRSIRFANLTPSDERTAVCIDKNAIIRSYFKI